MNIIEEISSNLNSSLGNQVIVKIGWVDKIKDFETPVVSITTYAHWQNHVDVNIWAYTDEERDKITEVVLTSLQQMEKQGVSIYEIMTIPFEEKGVLRPGKWNVIKNSKPIFR